jgi:GDP-L-fucose synthase
MVGSAIIRRLAPENCEVLTIGRSEVDLRRQAQVDRWMADNRPHAVFLAAATVGGILANDTRPADFLYDNLMIEANVMEAARQAGVEKLLFLGSSCIYPKSTPQPITEDALMTGPLEPTNQWYATAKIAGIRLAQAFRRQHGCDFISLMPSNLYGPNDTYDLRGSHVIPALMLKAHRAKTDGGESIEVWGTGSPRREFLHVDDLADACVFAMKRFSDELPMNVGSGTDITIADLARLICEIVGFEGAVRFDPSKPDGTLRKVMDIRRISALGWRPRIGLREGLQSTYSAFLGERIGSERDGNRPVPPTNQPA